VFRRGGELGWVVGCSSGGERRDGEEEGEEKEEEEEWGRECRQSGSILAFTDGIIDGQVSSVYLSVIPPVNVPRHCTEIPI